MNEAGSAGGGQKGYVPAPPAVFSDRRSNYSVETQMSNVGSAVSTTQMSRIGSAEKINQSDQNFMQTATSSRPSSHYESGDQQSHQNIQLLQSTETQQQNSSLINSGISIGVGLTRTQSVVNSGLISSNSNLVTSSSSSSNQSSDSSLAPAKKRVKLSDDSEFINDSVALEKVILEYNFMKLKNIKNRHTEYVAELYFLQNNGNMMEYPSWRKKSNTPQFINFMKSHRLEPPPLEEPEQSSRQIQQSNLPHGAEIKIPGVGATPVAVSTTLPLAVVQLSQQGGTPLVPDVSTDKRKMALPISAQSPSSGSHEQFSVKARQEVYVLQRVSELQREGLWMEKRLPKVQEPQRPKAHWDYLLEEMAWMATDFAQERKWKKAAAKKCARMVQKHFQDKALAAQRAEKAQEQQLRRIASIIAKEVKNFWSDVEKLVSFKQQQKLEEKRKIAFDQHLSFIVGQTEKFSLQLAEGMNKPVNDASAAASLNSSRISSPKPKTASDDEFEPGNVVSDDDEETIAKAELEDPNVDDEVAALQKESEMELDAFISGLPKDYLQNRDKIVLSDDDEQSDEQTDEEFKVTGDSDDDEDTIMEQEQNENKDDHKMEIDELNAENNMTIEELMAKYKSATPKSSKMEVDVDSDDDSTENESFDESEQSDNEDELAASDKDILNESFGLKSLLEEDSNKQSQTDKDDLINDAAAIAESIQPKGNTLSSTNVVTPVPFLLKHTLREYQHIGLDWLVTMHEQKLNGILADEMGLGKTIQTISLLAHLACVKENWGPHLIVVPSSVMLNWEMEFKKWCPGFKILTYYGTQKERKQKRIGWTKINAFHICITSYKLVIQDHQSFRRKKWKYLILDEAQNIKNFKSQRWQLLLNFSTEQRLLLTGTPLQNNLMELWSLMHFLMPHVFQSHREFKEWFSNPMTGMIEGNTEYNNSIIQRLHKVLRPFLLRRLKSEVEKQMPKKYEHVVMCRLSNRQRYLYDDFMSRAKTKETLESGNLLSVINVLMQLRKVCNHPNMFEVRQTISPFRMDGLSLRTTSLIANMLDYDPFIHIDLNALNLVLVQLEMCLTAYVAYRIKRLQTPKKLIEEIDSSPDPSPRPPSSSFKMHLTLLASGIQNNTTNSNCVKVGTSPAMKTERTKCVPQSPSLVNKKPNQPIPATLTDTIIPPLTTSTPTQSPNMSLRKRLDAQDIQTQQLSTPIVRQIVLTPASAKASTIVTTPSGQRLTVVKTSTPQRPTTLATKQGISLANSNKSVVQNLLSTSLGQQFKHSYTQSSNKLSPILPQEQSEFLIAETENLRKERRIQKLHFLAKINSRRCDVSPIYGDDLRETMFRLCSVCENSDNLPSYTRSYVHCQHAVMNRDCWSLTNAIKSFEQRTEEMRSLFGNFVIFVPAVSAPEPCLTITHPNPSKVNEELTRERIIRKEMSPKLALLHPIISAMSTQFPDPRLIQYDCGKLQTLDRLLRQLKSGSHRVLIFTQMTRMLDVLEAFLNYHGHIYLRLDGTTRIEQRQILMDRFNNDKRIFVFILSTRSGGVGVNLTGADTVIFYDSDWNPTMDAQAQDRCHRIGQTRDVHIYRLVSEKTIEENILKKANQKRLLGDLAIEGGNFTTAYFKGSTIQDLFTVDNNDEDASSRLAEVLDRDRDRRQRLQENLATTSNNSSGDENTAIGALESALAAAEDEQDVEATKIASAEVAADLAEFDESIPIEEGETTKVAEISKVEQEVDNLLSPIERYAMRFVEETGGSWTEQLRFAEAEIEQQKREWEANRVAALRKEEEDAKRAEEEENQLLTYSGVDARNQVNNRSKKTVNRSLGRNKSLTRRRSDIVKMNRRSRNITPRSPQSKRRTLPMTNSPKKRKNEEVKSAKRRTVSNTISRNIPKRLCRQTNNSRSEATDNDMDVSSDGGNASSNESKKGTSDSFIDSECSLDVMYDDSIDEQQSESNSVQASTTTSVENEKSESTDDESNEYEENCSEQNGNENIVKSISAAKRRVSITNRVDINSPRTRSRGTVKLNLFALDDSPILPSFGARSKRNQNKNQSNDVNDKNTSVGLLKNSRSRSNSSSDLSQKLKKDGASIVRAKRSRSKSPILTTNRSRSNSLSNDVHNMTTYELCSKIDTDDSSTVRARRSRSKSQTIDRQPTMRSIRSRSKSQSNDVDKMSTDDSRNTITVIKLAQIKDGLDGSKPLKPKRPPKKLIVKNGKSSSTLDSWLSTSKSPKIVLNKDDDAITKHLTQIASRSRRSSTIFKINSENGPS